MKIEGGCLCKVRYSADAEPTFVAVCHCKNCQKGTGTAFSVVVALPTPTLTVRGTLQTFTGRGDSGKATYRRFCPECGSALIDEAEILPNVTMIMAGTLDDASWVKPESEIFCDSAQPWVARRREASFPENAAGAGHLSCRVREQQRGSRRPLDLHQITSRTLSAAAAPSVIGEPVVDFT